MASSSSSAPSKATISAIHLAPLHPDDCDRTPSGLSHKDSFLSTFPEPNPRRQRRKLLPRLSWSWDKAETVLWAAVPLVFYVVGIVLLIAVLLSNGPEMAFMILREKGGTGRLEYYVLNSCATAPGTTERICTGRSLYVNFLPSLTKISSSLPGYSALKLPFYSFQTPSILVTSLSILILAFFLYLPLWTLVYFPHTNLLPPRFVRFVRYRSTLCFYVVGIVSFLGFVLTLSIGLGYKLYFLGYIDDFEKWYKFGLYRAGSNRVEWVAQVGNGFDAVWTATVCSAMTVVSINISLHNGLDEKVEWPEDQKEVNTFGAF